MTSINQISTSSLDHEFISSIKILKTSVYLFTFLIMLIYFKTNSRCIFLHLNSQHFIDIWIPLFFYHVISMLKPSKSLLAGPSCSFTSTSNSLNARAASCWIRVNSVVYVCGTVISTSKSCSLLIYVRRYVIT